MSCVKSDKFGCGLRMKKFKNEKNKSLECMERFLLLISIWGYNVLPNYFRNGRFFWWATFEGRMKSQWEGGDHTFLPHFRKTLSCLSVLMLSTTNSCMTNKEKSVQFQQSFYLCTAGQSQGEVGVNVVSQLVGSVKATSLICDKDVWSYYIYFILFSLTLHC